MEPLLVPLEMAEAEAAVRAADIRDGFAKMNLFRTTLRQPNVAQLWATVVEKLVVAGVLDARLRELIILRVAWVADGAYEWSNHYPFAKSIGMTDEEIVAVRDWQAANPALTDNDRLVLETVDALLAGQTPSSKRVAELRSIFGGDGPLMEFLVLPGIYHALAMLTGTLGIAVDGEKQAWEPDGVAPASVRELDGSSSR